MKHVSISCDLCGNKIHDEPMDSRGGHGLAMTGDGLWEIDRDNENPPKHLCNRCLSSIAKLKVCIAGVEGCGGGPKCGSDHK
jgi:hypothetical protein